MRLPISSWNRLTIVVVMIVAAGLAGAALLGRGGSTRSVPRAVPATTLAAAPLVPVATLPAPVLPVPAALTEAGLGLRAGPVAVPLELRIPALDIDAEVVGVGITSTNVMDAPMGGPGDPVWQQAFWYRGSAIPGAASTALIAGHIDGGGRLALFAHLDELVAGDLIVVHDTRSGLDVRFAVTSSHSYTLDEAADPVVLTQIYGAGPVTGTWPQPSVDGLAHLTLITCSGTYTNGTHDHRLVVYATRVA